jgi:chaperonin GroES
MALLPQPTGNEIPPDRRGPPPRVNGDAGPSEGIDVGEYLQVGTDPDAIQLIPDENGGAFVEMPGERVEEAPKDDAFYANLAAVIPPAVQTKIVTDLLRRIEEDKEARKKRDEQYEEGIRRTGLGKDAPGGADFEGASRAVHPMMEEACIDYEARVIKELLPLTGPVKPNVLGVPTAEKTAKADRVAAHMNYQFAQQIKEARGTLETTLMQVPLGGTQCIRLWFDHRLKRQRMEFASIDKVHLPANAADFQSAHRKTFEDKISAVEFRHRVEQGMYLDLDLVPPAQDPEPTKSESASRKVEGVEDNTTLNLDGNRTIFETMTYLEVTEEMAAVLDVEKAGDLYPYLITMDETTKSMLACYRCWEDGDPAREAIDCLYDFPFIPWRGPLAIGFPHIIGGLSAAATGGLRALLDSAHTQNAIGGYILKGAGAGGQTRQPTIGNFTELDGSLETDDIRKRVLPFSFSPPSPVLFQLLGWVTEAAKGVVRTSLDDTPADSNTNVPVGTQMSRVEQGLVVFSAIHGRAHAAFSRLIKGMYRLNRLYLPEQLKIDAAGKEIMVRRADYQGPCDVQPVSDPTIYSDQQRFGQLNYIQARMTAVPQLYRAREVELAGLKLIKWPDPEALLNPQPQPHELNAVNENLALTLGQPVAAFPEQDHLAHLQVLLDFMKSPALGANPLIAPSFLPGALKHAVEHIAYHYVQTTVAIVRQAAGKEPAELFSRDPAVKAALDRLLAQASQKIVPSVEQAMQGALPVLQGAMAMMKQMMPPPPVDPAAAAVQAAAAETARKGQQDQAGNQLDAAKLQQTATQQQQANAIQAERNQIMADNADAANQTKIETTQLDNSTALEISQDRAMSGGGGGGFVNGESMTRQ